MYNRKKEEQLGFDNVGDIGFNPNKTFGGEKIKLPVYNNPKQEGEDMARKQFTNTMSQGNMKEELNKFRSQTPGVGSVYNK